MAGAAPAERRAIEYARVLVGERLTCDIVVIDPELAPDSEAIRRLDAFTVREQTGRLRPKIYVNRESPILREAARGHDFYVKVLAAVLVHEIEHLKGGTERAARAAERRFFADLIAQGVVDAAEGLRYAAMLRKRHPENGRER